jgi:uncharacterized integral membrane protein
MSKVYFFISILLLAAVTVFALINTKTAPVNIPGFAPLNPSVAMLVVCCVAIGAALMALMDLGRYVNTWREMRELKHKLKTAEEELKLLRAKNAPEEKKAD